jgi:LysR family transcriptional regulator, transcriptional activator of nhaA
MLPPFSYRHLYYFWVVAKEGGMSRAAERLGTAVQTVSTQVRELERSLGHVLLKPAGRGLELTEAGKAALQRADQIFQLGEELPALVRAAGTEPGMRLALGIADSLPKLVIHRLLGPVEHESKLRLVCHQNAWETLLADLALHKLDLVLADQPAPTNPNIKLYSHPLGASPLSWYATPALASKARKTFPASLAELPVLLPTHHSAVRARLDLWFEQHGLRPQVRGEFEDSALLKTFGASGMGIFPAVDWVHADILAQYKVQRIGPCEGVQQHFFAIGTQKKVQHPLVLRLLQQDAA